MNDRTHAAAGAWTLVQRPGRQTTGGLDARVAFELVGSATSEMDYLDPIAAARAWLRNPAHGATLPVAIKDRASRTIDLAEAHLREIDVLAGQVAVDANETGFVDLGRLEQIDLMSSSMRRYAVRLRAMLDEAPADPDDVVRRIDGALLAANHGGFDAFVAAL